MVSIFAAKQESERKVTSEDIVENVTVNQGRIKGLPCSSEGPVGIRKHAFVAEPSVWLYYFLQECLAAYN